MINRFVLTVVTVFICAVIPSAATAGTVIEVQFVGYQPGFKDGTGVLYFDKNGARMESKTGEDNELLVYSGNGEPRLWFINDAEWTYNEVSKKNVGKLRGKIQNRLEQIQKYLSRLDREQRETTKQQFAAQISMMERLIRENYEKKISYEKTETGVAVGDLKCDLYKRLYYDQFDGLEVYAAPWDQVDASREDFVVVDDIIKTFGGFAAQFSWFGLMWSEKVNNRIDGFPMRFVVYGGETKAMRIDVTAIRHEDLDSKLFELPEDFDETPFMGLD